MKVYNMLLLLFLDYICWSL